jgi:ketosteroid isomerase-like protein
MAESNESLTNCKFIKDWIENNLPLEDLDREVTFVIPGSESNPIFGTFKGIEEVINFFRLLQEKLTEKEMEQTFEVTNCIAEGNQVVALVKETFTSKNSSSEHYLNHSAWYFRLNDKQKIVYLYTYDDTLATSKALA